jgi:DNA-binding GntR family transcriptional regulator
MKKITMEELENFRNTLKVLGNQIPTALLEVEVGKRFGFSNMTIRNYIKRLTQLGFISQLNKNVYEVK